MQDRVECLGHVIYRDTIMPSETKVAAIRMCPTPRSKTELRTFLGSVNYLSKFIPELQAKCVDLYQLCGKNNIWKLTAEHDKAFEVVKEAMLDARVLQPFNIAAKVHIASNASESGLGAVMFQKYNYDIQYIRGTENVLADILSRFAIEEYQVGSSEEEFISLIQDAALTDLQLTREQIRNESLVDPELKQIRRYLESWWPNGCNHEDVLLWLQRIVIPTSCRQKSAHVLHTGHPGINTMKELARRYCWWPSIETDIEHTVGTCQLCQSRRNAAPEVPLHQWDVPMQPWERLHVDFAGPVAGRLFILVIDAYSHWPEIEEIINTSASETIKKLRKRMVQTFKRRVDMSEGNLELTLAQFLMTYRNTKQSSTGVSPAVLMFGRRLSTIWDRLRPRKVQKTQHNIRAQPRSFMVSQSVWLRDTQRKRWEPGYIMSKNGSESYTVDTPAGPRRRHVNDIRNRVVRVEATNSVGHYLSLRAHELSSEDVLLWLQRIVIPTSCRQKSAHVLHTGHPGINTMKELARRYCWWPSIETDIEHTVGTCQLCQSRRNAAPEVPLHQWDVPMQPWERLHVDFAGPVAGRLFILVIDAYSHWPEIEEIINTSASETIKKLRNKVFRCNIIDERTTICNEYCSILQ
ncbi:hypothetical protein GJ496_006584 [Pomphorhynchus laevis]|nr:hypothetical protein GJ496_006584 [Pomphorhynchus laevis]